MVNLENHRIFASLLLAFSAQSANADLLFTNYTGNPFGGSQIYSGGTCADGCFAIGDNFTTNGPWNVTGFTYHVFSQLTAGQVGTGVRYALFTTAGVQVVAPTNASPNVTDTGLTYFGIFKIYKVEITGLDIDLTAGSYKFRATNTISREIYPGYGTPSAQSVDPAMVQLLGSDQTEPLLSTTELDAVNHWAFEVHGTNDLVLLDGFEDP